MGGGLSVVYGGCVAVLNPGWGGGAGVMLGWVRVEGMTDSALRELKPWKHQLCSTTKGYFCGFVHRT